MFFYLIDKKTLIPKLDMVMRNYMNCSSLLFGPRIKSAIAFTESQKNVQIHQRQMYHNFRVHISARSFENAVALEMAKDHRCVIGNNKTITFWCLKENHVCDTIEIKSDSSSVILYIQVSQSEKHMAVLTGTHLKKRELQIDTLYIYAQKVKSKKWALRSAFEYKFDDGTCHMFSFSSRNKDKLLMFSSTRIFEFNYQTLSL